MQDYLEMELEDKIQDECGVFATWGVQEEDLASLTYVGLHALQHRGQESAGIAVTDGNTIMVEKGMGLLADVFDETVLAGLKGKATLGHVRYAPKSSSNYTDAMPLTFTFSRGSMAYAHNGAITNVKALRDHICETGGVLQTTNDAEVIAQLLARYCRPDHLEEALMKTMVDVQGAYSIALLSKDFLIGMRDPQGYRPLCIGTLKGGYVLASESCALQIVGAEFLREVEPGEIIIINDSGIHSTKYQSSREQAFCIFEYVYIARPDSRFGDMSVTDARKRMGANLFKETQATGDVVLAVPDSGICAAIGYSQASGIPYESGLIKNRYIGRTFIQPTQVMRETSVRLKLNPVPAVVKDKTVILVDDSIVRGTTSKKIIKMVKEAGAKCVKLMITSPPVLGSCFFGVDTKKADLIAATHSVEEIREYIGADELHFISEEGLLDAVAPANLPGFCCACFNCKYKTEVPEEE